MTNAIKSGTTKQIVAKARDNLEIPCSMGYNDALAGRPFAPEYETATALWQNNYEIGRLRAVNVVLAGLKPVAWQVGKPQSPRLIGQYRKAAALVGSSVPRSSNHYF